MKRHQVMNLFHWKKIEEHGEWIPFINPNQLHEDRDKVKVKQENGDEKYAYFYRDFVGFIQNYIKKSSYFWDCQTQEPLFNVTHFKYLKEKEE